MKLKESQIQIVSSHLDRYSLESDLKESLTDHICCLIEENDKNDFHSALEKALTEFGHFGPKEINESIHYLTKFKSELHMKKNLYIISYLSVILITTGILFKMMHWPSANIQIVLGVAMLNFGVLPMFFIGRYRKAANS